MEVVSYGLGTARPLHCLKQLQILCSFQKHLTTERLPSGLLPFSFFVHLEHEQSGQALMERELGKAWGIECPEVSSQWFFLPSMN